MKVRAKKILAMVLSTALMVTSLSPISLVSADVAEPEIETQAVSEYEIYPKPQSVSYLEGGFDISSEVNLVYETGVDQYTKNKMDTVLELKESITSTTTEDTVVAGKTNVLIGVYGSDGTVDNYFETNGLISDASLFDKGDSYILSIKDGVIAILGKNADAAFYGVTSLKHIFRQMDGMNILNLKIDDYSDVAFRGFIEGYYGNPWSNEDRADLMTYGGEFKANTYIFAPKDDPYHNLKWRELYPEEELAEIAKLAEAGNASKCRYVWSIHPFMNSPFNFSTEETYQNDFGVITAKFTQLLEHGVRQFGVLADDAGAASTANMVKLLNDLTEWLKEQQSTYPDLKIELPFCPAAYYGAYPDTGFSALPETVQIIQTGGKIWGEVSESFSDTFINNMGRSPFYWVNWPCTDNSKQHLIMGGQNTFLHAGVTPSKIAGIVLNPMQQSEPSKAAIFFAADYAWNVWQTAEEGDQSWEDCFDYIDHMNANETEASTALKELSKHMINQNMDSRVAVLQESVDLAPSLDTFKEDYSASKKVADQANELITEFETINQAAKYFEENAGNARFAGQITYWLSAAKDITEANIELLKAVIALEEGNNDAVWSHYSNGLAAYEQSKTYDFWYVNGMQTAEFGVQHIVPFAKYLMQNLSGSVIGIVDPTKVVVNPITNRDDTPTGDLSNLLDGSNTTECVWKSPNTISTGTYIGVMYNRVITVNDITFEMGAISNANDKFTASKLQYTVDGSEWVDVPDATFGNVTTISIENLDLQVKGIRLVATQDKTNTWLGCKEIIINKNDSSTDEPGEDENLKLEGTVIKTDTFTVEQGTSEASLIDDNDSTFVWYKGRTGDNTIVGDYLGFNYGQPYTLGKIHIVVGNSGGDKWEKYKLEYSTDGETWTKFKDYTGAASGMDVIDEDLSGQEITAQYVRLVNTEAKGTWVKFSEFRVEKMSSGGLTKYTYTNNDDLKTLQNTYSNDVTTIIPTTDVTLAKDEYVGIKLNRIKDLAALNVATNSTKLTLQTSANAVEWKNVTDQNEVDYARYIRLINNTNESTTFDITSFEVRSNEISEPTFMETSMGINAAYGAEDSRNKNTLGNLFDGKMDTKVQFCDYPKKDGFIKYDLGQVRTINTLELYALDTEINYIRDGIVQISLDGTEWTDVVTIGDGVENEVGDDILNNVGWVHDTIYPAMVKASSVLETPTEARYLRVLFTANYGSRFVSMNEIVINDGEYVKTTNDPTYEASVNEIQGNEPQNLFDGDLSTAYKPNMEGVTEGSLIYRLSENTEVKQINILQNGKAISNAVVSARVDADKWVTLGTLDKSLNMFYNTKYDNIYEIKLEWSEASPIIYEMILLGEEHATLPTEVESVTLDKTAVSLEVGATDTLKATVNPDNATDKTVTWTTDKASVATVKGGTITAVAEGTANITATAGGKTATCKVTVTKVETPVVPVQSVTLDKTAVSLEVGATDTLKATVNPDNATDKTVTWTTDKASVATVTDGIITAVAEGTANITATAGGKTATCKVTVTKVETPVVPVQSVTLDKTAVSLEVGATDTLKATVNPDNATDKTVTWTTDKASVATVKGGTITAVAEGTANITATAGGKTATCKVTVTKVETPVVPVQSVTLDKTAVSLEVGAIDKIKATVNPSDATDKTVKWTTDKASVATVKGGTITAVAEGTAKITATAGEKTATCIVTVTKAVGPTHPENGWDAVGNKWKYYENNIAAKSKWIHVYGAWYYMGKDEYMTTKWQSIGGKWYYLGTNGKMVTKWSKIDNRWYYFNNSGAMLTKWQKIDNRWYYFNNSGAMLTKWQKIDNNWYYFNKSGAMVTNWYKEGKTWYYLKASGAMATGWNRIGGTWYYMNASGKMQTGWQKVKGLWYYMDGSGKMQTGWVLVKGTYYYLNGSGAWTGKTK